MSSSSHQQITEYYSILGNDPTYLSSISNQQQRLTTVLPKFSGSGSSSSSSNSFVDDSNNYYDGGIDGNDDDILYGTNNLNNYFPNGGGSINDYNSSSSSSSFVDEFLNSGPGVNSFGSYMNNNDHNFDSTTSTNSSFSSVGSTSSWFLVIVLTSIIVITIVGNILVCLAVILVRKLRKPQNYLLVSLATSDLFVALFVMPFATVAEFHENRWPLNPALCDLWVSADVLCCTASILNLCGISLDRYRAITSPLEYSAKTSPKRMLAVIFVVWLGSACVSLPPLLLLGNIHFLEEDPSVPICTVSQNFWYQIYATMMSFYVPLCVMVVVYVKILRVVADKKKEMSWKHRSTSNKQSQATQLPPANKATVLVVKNGSSVGAKKGFLSNKRQTKTDIRLNNTNTPNGGPLLPPLPTPPTTQQQSTITTTSLTIGGGGGGGQSPGAPSSTTTSVGFIYPSPSTNTITATMTTTPKTKTTTFSTLHRLKKGQLPFLYNKLLGGLREHKASTTLGIIMSAFIICWLPFFVLALVRPFCSIYHVEIPEWVSSLFLWLGYTNSALNPVIYATLNRDFRRPFKEILCLRCSTLDSLMRREFYNQQFGEDTETLRQTTKQTFNSASRRQNIEADTPTHL